MVVAEKNFIEEMERLNWMRIGLVLASFAAGMVLVRIGQVRPAILTVGAVMVLGGIGYHFAVKGVLRSESLRTGKSIAELRKELKKR